MNEDRLWADIFLGDFEFHDSLWEYCDVDILDEYFEDYFHEICEEN